MNNKSFRLPATLIFAGILLSFAAGYFHPDHAPANNHVAAFTEYASSRIWTLVHLGNFLGMLIIVAGLLTLQLALNVQSGTIGLINRFAAVIAGIALALYGVLEAVDGVALKHAVDAWVLAAGSEKLMRFASAESIRWLEWAIRSYQCFTLGLSFLLFGLVVLWTAKIPRVIGLLMSVSALAYFTEGWIVGREGFASDNFLPGLIAILSVVIWSLWLLIVAWSARGLPANEEQPIPNQPISTRKMIL